MTVASHVFKSGQHQSEGAEWAQLCYWGSQQHVV